MGFYRFWLALAVVIFHFGGGNWIVGRTAVFGFFMVSGFLIARVVDRTYGRNVPAFYANRALRIVPLYAVICVATAILVLAHGTVAFDQENDRRVNLFAQSVLDNPTGWGNYSLIPQWSTQTYIPLLAAGPNAVPQGWSLTVELAFYAVAPLVVLVLQRRSVVLTALAVALTGFFLWACFAVPDYRMVENVVYKNALTDLFMFLWGCVAYAVWRERPALRINPLATLGVVLGFSLFILFYGPRVFGREPNVYGFVVPILLSAPVTAAVCLMAPLPARLRRLDNAVGNLSYGIYLNHFICAGILLWIAEILGSDVFGVTNHPGFGWWCAALSIAMAALTYRLVEAPIEALRRRLKPAAAGEHAGLAPATP